MVWTLLHDETISHLLGLAYCMSAIVFMLWVTNLSFTTPKRPGGSNWLMRVVSYIRFLGHHIIGSFSMSLMLMTIALPGLIYETMVPIGVIFGIFAYLALVPGLEALSTPPVYENTEGFLFGNNLQ